MIIKEKVKDMIMKGTNTNAINKYITIQFQKNEYKKIKGKVELKPIELLKKEIKVIDDIAKNIETESGI